MCYHGSGRETEVGEEEEQEAIEPEIRLSKLDIYSLGTNDDLATLVQVSAVDDLARS